MRRSRPVPAALTRHGHWLAVGLPLLLPLAWSLRGLPGMDTAFAWLTPLVLYGLLPLLDWAIGRDPGNPPADRRSLLTDSVIPACAAGSYFLVLAWALARLAVAPDAFGPLALAGWIVSLANLGGVVAINVSHELIHRRDRLHRALGGLLLATVCYPGFKLEHPRWHHAKVATPEDPSSAPRGANVYRQAPRAWWRNTVCAWRLAADDARRDGRPLPALNNEMGGWTALSLLIVAGVGFAFGPLALAVFLAHGLGAALLLEVINFVEHYGLRRRRREDGRWEPPRPWHSWDSEYWLSNALLLQLPRHADHHVHPSRPYAALQYRREAPRLPFGYATAVLVALVPPLWRRVMDPRLPPEGAPARQPTPA